MPAKPKPFTLIIRTEEGIDYELPGVIMSGYGLEHVQARHHIGEPEGFIVSELHLLLPEHVKNVADMALSDVGDPLP
jgi:hypothetical protein